MSRNGPLRYQQIWANLEARLPEHRRTACVRRRAAERLLAELMSGQPAEWLARLDQRRFHTQDLFELLLEACHAALPFDRRHASEISEMVLELGRLLSQRAAQDREEDVESLCRALCLAGHARRLIGDHQGAEIVLSRAAFLATDPAARGFFCRAFALLRWDQGRAEEAAALLLQASGRYEELGDALEEAACLGLLGLLLTEEGEFSRAAPVLRKALRNLDGRARPWLAAQARLALALGLAVADRKQEARAAREEAWRFYQGVPKEDELFSLLWREGQVAEVVGDLADAAHLFDSVRLKFIDRGYLPEATLASLQLGMILARLGRGEETLPLAGELAAGFAGRPGLAFSIRALRCLAEETAGGPLEVESWSFLGPNFLIAYRLQGLYPQPMAFV